MRKFHLMNKENRDAGVAFTSLKYIKEYELGTNGKPALFKRYLAAGETGLHDVLTARLGADYGTSLVEGDPEIDLEVTGMRLGDTDEIYLSAKDDILYAPPKIIELVLGPDGSEKKKGIPKDIPGNVDDDLPVKWTGKKIPKKEAVRMFVFKRTIQLKHVDGLTFDYLYEMAAELHNENAVVLVGAGKKGTDPLVFQMNGTPYRGFVEGRVDGARYQLLLHLRNMELKKPVETARKKK